MLFCANDGDLAFTIVDGRALCVTCWKAAGGEAKPLPKNLIKDTAESP